MKTDSLKKTLVLVGALLFNILFWQEKLGINTVLFDAFIIGCIFYLYPRSFKNTACISLATGHLITAAMVVVHNTVLSKLGFSITLLLFASFSQYVHRSAWYAGGSVILNYVFAIPDFFFLFNRKTITISGLSRPVRLLLIPLVILTIFFAIYNLANTAFSRIASDIVVAVERWLANIFDWVSLPRFGFFLLGIILTAGAILKVRRNYFSNTDLQQSDNLSRKKGILRKWKQSPFSDLLTIVIGKAATGMLAIKNEFTIGLVSLILLNVLLLFINIIDIRYVWLGFTFSSDVSLSAYVHEGAGLLILSIILAMLLLLFFFRANINFYKQNKWLKYGAYLWIFQNLFLVISVFVRDYYYISHYGLAYKRIGLLFFLAMVLGGLVTVFLKIHFRKTNYYLLRINAWAGIFLLVFATTIHWDYTIAKYNLDRKSSIPLDVPFLLSLSDKTLPLVEKHKEILYQKINDVKVLSYNYRGSVEFFEYRKKRFLDQQKRYTWLSWNASDEYVKKELKIYQVSAKK